MSRFHHSGNPMLGRGYPRIAAALYRPPAAYHVCETLRQQAGVVCAVSYDSGRLEAGDKNAPSSEVLDKLYRGLKLTFSAQSALDSGRRSHSTGSTIEAREKRSWPNHEWRPRSSSRHGRRGPLVYLD
jgi:hypothetical protein